VDPVTLAVLTSAVTTLATKAAEGFGEEAGKSLWEKVKGALGFASNPSIPELPIKVATQLERDPAAAAKVYALLNGQEAEHVGVRQLVGTINAKNVTVAGTVQGGISMS
jgi:hypothetical protein